MIWSILALAFLMLLAWIALRSASIGDLTSHAKPVGNYEDALTLVRAMQEDDNQDSTRDVCITKLYDHGHQTDHVIILIHGFTNCPEQFNELGQQYYQAGNNVFLPRMPHHGNSDRLTNALVDFTAEKLAEFGDRVIDIAHGLGKKVTVMGISGSGTLVAWLAQNRQDIDYAFAIAPLFGLAFVPAWFTRIFERIAGLLPNFYMWWDPRTRANNPFSIYYAYPGYPIRALKEIMKLAMMTRLQAAKSPPKARHITLIINDSEPGVSNPEILKFLALWRKYEQGNLNEVHFERDLNLPHDIITPGTPGVPIREIQSRLMGTVRETHRDSISAG
jgi:carboxylesterase